jgi:hypothetical protein
MRGAWLSSTGRVLSDPNPDRNPVFKNARSVAPGGVSKDELSGATHRWKRVGYSRWARRARWDFGLVFARWRSVRLASLCLCISVVHSCFSTTKAPRHRGLSRSKPPDGPLERSGAYGWEKPAVVAYKLKGRTLHDAHIPGLPRTRKRKMESPRKCKRHTRKTLQDKEVASRDSQTRRSGRGFRFFSLSAFSLFFPCPKSVGACPRNG